VRLAGEASHLPASQTILDLGVDPGMKKKILGAWTRFENYQNLLGASDCRQSKILIPEPSKSRAARMLGRTRNQVRQLVGILTGHCPLNKFMHLISQRGTPLCQFCDQITFEDALHFLCLCPGFATTRENTFGTKILDGDQIRSAGLDKIEKFITDTGRLRLGPVEAEVDPPPSPI
jgi:hypothetical protein